MAPPIRSHVSFPLWYYVVSSDFIFHPIISSRQSVRRQIGFSSFHNNDDKFRRPANTKQRNVGADTVPHHIVSEKRSLANTPSLIDSVICVAVSLLHFFIERDCTSPPQNCCLVNACGIIALAEPKSSTCTLLCLPSACQFAAPHPLHNPTIIRYISWRPGRD